MKTCTVKRLLQINWWYPISMDSNDFLISLRGFIYSKVKNLPCIVSVNDG